ncbi:hypothetical protein PG987_008039 [Apiospora arundinis]
MAHILWNTFIWVWIPGWQDIKMEAVSPVEDGAAHIPERTANKKERSGRLPDADTLELDIYRCLRAIGQGHKLAGIVLAAIVLAPAKQAISPNIVGVGTKAKRFSVIWYPVFWQLVPF